MVSLTRAALIALLGLALPAVAAAQQRAPAAAPPSQAVQQQVRQMITEMDQLNAKLESIQARAAQDTQLQAQQAALGAEIKAAMDRADPQLPAKLQRIQALEAEARAAQQAGDQAKLQQLAREAQTIQRQFVQAQAQVMQQPAMAAKVQAFQTRLEARMAQVDPESPALVKRFRELEAKLAATMQANAGGPR